jgi:hypothetical protein
MGLGSGNVSPCLPLQCYILTASFFFPFIDKICQQPIMLRKSHVCTTGNKSAKLSQIVCSVSILMPSDL